MEVCNDDVVVYISTLNDVECFKSAHTHMHAHTGTLHTRTHATHAYTHTLIHTRTLAHNTYMHSHTQYTHMCTYSHTHTHTLTINRLSSSIFIMPTVTHLVGWDLD